MTEFAKQFLLPESYTPDYVENICQGVWSIDNIWGI